jgi:opacity protein-like surface antigen
MKKNCSLVLGLFFALFGLFSTCVHAQDYGVGIGLRVLSYGGIGVTGKKIFGDNKALELNATFRNYGLSSYNYFEIGGLYERYHEISGVDGLNWLAGGGVNIGFYKYKYFSSSTNIGISGIAGLEYKFPNTPITVGIDYMPLIWLTNGFLFSSNRGGLTARYVF